MSKKSNYRKQQAKARKSAINNFDNHIKRDLGLQSHISTLKATRANPAGGVIFSTFTHMSPKRVITDTCIAYETIFEDEGGEYTFSIYKSNGGYRIVADGVEMFKTDVEHILWDFENQLSEYGPKVLNGRTYGKQGTRTTILSPAGHTIIKQTHFEEKA